MIRTEGVLGSESLCFSILRINGGNILEQEEEKRIKGLGELILR